MNLETPFNHNPDRSDQESRVHLKTGTFSSYTEHRQSKLCGSSLDFEFTRECMKINKIRPRFHFSTKIEVKMTYLEFVFCYLLAGNTSAVRRLLKNSQFTPNSGRREFVPHDQFFPLFSV